jgi:hypothetical protein
MATVYKIHPAIGIARVGNCPDEFFIGPEKLGQHPNPPGGFKDAQCRVKRQAARFRIYAHHDDGSVQEITAADAEINWTVHLVNQKAANPARGNSGSVADLTIDPGPRTLTGPLQRAQFDNGTIQFSSGPRATVPLGEIRSDTDNHLLVLGGSGHSASPPGTGLSGFFWASPDWYDDISDGPVTATIKLRSDGSTPPIVAAWVVVAPPKFSPHTDSVITLYDRVFQAMVEDGKIPKPTVTSYTADVYPILQRARDTQWVAEVLGSHTWPDPVVSDTLRHAIFNKLKAPGGGGGNMPKINDSGTNDDRLTQTQYDHMQRWNDNTFTNDWVAVPAPQANITPEGLDRAALEACVGGAFFPGIEAGGLPPGYIANLPAEPRPIIRSSNYVEPFRLDVNVVAPGGISNAMALPWQNDFYQCAANWWPVPRPNSVIRQGTPNQGWTDGPNGVTNAQDMVDKWSQLGFVVNQGNQNLEAERCSVPSITLLTPLLNFQDVPQGPMGMVRETPLAITFEVISPTSAVTLQYSPGGAPNHPQLVAFNSSVTVGPTAASVSALARLWVIYRTGNPGDVLPAQQVTVQQQGTSAQWSITVLGNTIARKTAAAALTLDRSGSMSEDRGDGQSKHASLQQAASIFVDVMLEGDGIGIVSFNEASQVLQTVVQLGSGGLSDINRSAVKDVINGNGLDPLGATSIGNGIYDARGILNSATTLFDVKSLVVLTDGVENRSRYIADVAPQINEFTYAVGLGTPQNTSAAALQAISGNHGGFLLLTGAIGQDNRFLLQKYFLQILAGVSNADIVLDPDGQLIPGRVERIPFQMIRGDAGVDVILLTPFTGAVDFRLQTPSGRIIEPWLALSDPDMRYIQSAGVSYYRLVLPVELQPGRFDQEGTWNALLTIGKPHTQRTPDTRDGIDPTILRGMNARASRQESLRGLQAETQRISSRAASVLAAAAFETGPAQSAVGRYGRTLPYSLIVHAYSNLSLGTRLQQSSFEPGATINLYATLSQSGIPISSAQVWAEVARPDGTNSTVNFASQENQFFAAFATTSAGIYRFRVRARGNTPRGETFVRERTLTAGVWNGGNHDADPNQNGRVIVDYLRDRDSKLCELFRCLTRSDGAIGRGLEERLRVLGLDLTQTRKCLGILCSGQSANDTNRDE